MSTYVSVNILVIDKELYVAYLLSSLYLLSSHLRRSFEGPLNSLPKSDKLYTLNTELLLCSHLKCFLKRREPVQALLKSLSV
jgi:hypothetical protein